MEIKAIIEKLKKGEALTDEERKFLAEYDHDKAINGAQAEARRKAEAQAEKERKEREKLTGQIEDLQRKLKEKDDTTLTETQKLQQALSDLQQKFEASERRSQELARAQAKAARSVKIQDLAKKLGVQFIDGVDAKMLATALESSLSSMKDEQLDDENLVKPLVESFKSANKAVIRDTSGGGGGTPPKDGTGPRGLDGKPVNEMTPAEREKDLKQRGIV